MASTPLELAVRCYVRERWGQHAELMAKRGLTTDLVVDMKAPSLLAHLRETLRDDEVPDREVLEAAEVAAVDRQIGRSLERLRSLADRTEDPFRRTILQMLVTHGEADRTALRDLNVDPTDERLARVTDGIVENARSVDQSIEGL